jgi:hypothetical protein
MTDSSSHQRGCYIRIITAVVELRKNNSGLESQGARRQDEVIGGKRTPLKTPSPIVVDAYLQLR